jgi:hypothetical protein
VASASMNGPETTMTTSVLVAVMTMRTAHGRWKHHFSRNMRGGNPKANYLHYRSRCCVARPSRCIAASASPKQCCGDRGSLPLSTAPSTRSVYSKHRPSRSQRHPTFLERMLSNCQTHFYCQPSATLTRCDMWTPTALPGPPLASTSAGLKHAAGYDPPSYPMLSRLNHSNLPCGNSGTGVQ